MQQVDVMTPLPQKAFRLCRELNGSDEALRIDRQIKDLDTVNHSFPNTIGSRGKVPELHLDAVTGGMPRERGNGLVHAVRGIRLVIADMCYAHLRRVAVPVVR